MGYARYIGRVGALAVAMGIGVAVGTTPGLSWAQTDSNSASDGGQPSSNLPAGSTGTDGADGTDGVSGDATPGDGGHAGSATTSQDPPSDSEDDAAADLTDPDPADDPEPDQDADDAPDSAEGTELGVGDEDTEEEGDDSGDGTAVAANDNSSGSSDSDRRVFARVAQQPAPQTDPDPGVSDPVQTFVGLRSIADKSTPAPMISMSTTSTTIKPLVPPVAPTAAVTTFVNMATEFVANMLSPLIGSGPNSPVSTPVLFAVLAFARREIDQFVVGLTPPAAAVSTGQLLKAAPQEAMMTTFAAPASAAAAAAPAAAPGGTPGLIGSVAIVVDSTLQVVGNLLSGLLGGNKAPVIAPTIGNPDPITGVITGKVNATDPNNDPITYDVTIAPAKGTLVVIPTTGAFTYTPTPQARAAAQATPGPDADRFAIRVRDNRGGATTATFNNVPVTPTNRAPINGAFTPDVSSPTSAGVVTGAVTATDPDGDTLTYGAATTTTAKGTFVSQTNGRITYTPTTAGRHAAATGGAAATDSTTVTVNDGHGGTLAVPVTVNIVGTNQNPINGVAHADAPDSAGIVHGTVTATDPDGDPLSFGGSSTTVDGTVAVTTDGNIGRFTYTPSDAARQHAAETTADDSYTFAVSVNDGHGGTLSVPVSATVTPTNRAPINGAFTPDVSSPTSAGVVTGAVTATDPDGDTLTYSAATTTTAKGTFVSQTNGRITYTPTTAGRHAAATGGAAATDSTTVTVNDGHGGTLAVPVTVNIVGTNQNPINGVAHADAPDSAGIVHGTVTATDPDGDPLSFGGSSTTVDGTVAVTTDGNIGRFTYTPSDAARQHAAETQDDTDTYAFTVTVNDGHGGTLNVPVAATIAPAVQTAPPGTPVVSAPDPETGVVTVTFEPGENGPVTATAVTDPPHGTATVNPDGSVTFTPDPDAQLDAHTTPATDTFTATVTDSSGATNTVPVTVPIQPLASLPVQTNQRPQWVAFSEDGTRVYVSNEDSDTVSVYDAHTYREIGTIALGDAPGFVATAPDGRIWVSNRGDDTVSVIDPDSGTVLTTFDVGDEPIGITFGSNGVAYVANRATVSPGVSGNGAISVVDRTSYVVLHEIPTPSPVFTALNHDETQLWVTNQYDGTLTVFDTTDYHLIATIPVARGTINPPYPTAIQFNNDGTRAYYTNQFDDSLQVIDTTTYEITRIYLGDGTTPAGLAINADGSRAYVADFSGRNRDDLRPGSISVVDLDTGTVIQTITVGVGPIGAKLNPVGDRLWVANSGGSITVIPITPPHVDGTTIPLGANTYPTAVTFNPDGTRAYVANSIGNTVSIIDTSNGSVIGIVPVGQYPFDVAVSPDGTRVYTANYQDNTVTVIDTTNANPPTTIQVAGNPSAVVVNPDPLVKRVYVANRTGSTISVIDTSTNTALDPIFIGGISALAISPDGKYLYASGPGNNSMSVISTDTNTVVNTVLMPGTHDNMGIAVSANGTRVYVADHLNGKVTAVDTTDPRNAAVVGTTFMTTHPWGLAVSQDGTRVYTANTNDNTVTMIDTSTNTVINTIPVGNYNYDVAVYGNHAYVTNAMDGTVTVLDLTPSPL